MIRFRQPLIEETEYELAMEEEEAENFMVEEDDLKTTSEESSAEDEDEEAKEQRRGRERRRIVKEVMESILEAVEEQEKKRMATEEDIAKEEERLRKAAEKEQKRKEREERLLEKMETLEDFWKTFMESHGPNQKSKSRSKSDKHHSSKSSSKTGGSKSSKNKSKSKKKEEEESEEELSAPRRKYGSAWPKVGYHPTYTIYTRFNPHTRENIRLMAAREDATLCLTRVLNEVYHYDLIEERMAGGLPRPGTPDELTAGKKFEPLPILGAIRELVPNPPKVQWEPPLDDKPRIEHDDSLPLFPVNQLELDADTIRKLYKQEFNRRVRSSDNLEQWMPKGKNGKIPRRVSNTFYQITIDFINSGKYGVLPTEKQVCGVLRLYWRALAK